MKDKFKNSVRIEGYLYDHNLTIKESGPQSKHPGTVFIGGTVSIATDDGLTNIVPINYTYVTALTAKNEENKTFTVLKKIIDGDLGTVMGNGADNATLVRADTSIGLNEFYTDRSGQEELVRAKRNDNGFLQVVPKIAEKEKDRNNFDVDMVITKVRVVEADLDRNLPEKAIISGCIFNFRKELLPVEFSATNPNAISYFTSLGVSPKTPMFTELKGKQISETVTREIVEESAFGDPSVRTVTSSRKDWVITWARPDAYDWDDPSTITAAELTTAMAAAEIRVADIKKRNDEYKASRNAGAFTASTNGVAKTFDF